MIEKKPGNGVGGERSQKSKFGKVAYRTKLGRMHVGKIEDVLDVPSVSALRGQVNLIFTSPPFPLVSKKRYGNETGATYLKWLEALAPRLCDLLARDGSIVMEIGNSWEPGVPVMSTLGLEALLAFKKAANLHLSQQIICHNPARLPSPAQWVNVNRERLKDSFTHVWWMSKTEHPKADNRRVLLPYSSHMKGLLKSQKYNSGTRPSGHVISKSGFLKNHGGAIAPNVIEADESAGQLPSALMKFSGTSSDAKYQQYCAKLGLEAHPARMQMGLATFFIEFLTQPGDTVFDPFGGSNTTGFAAESLKRQWVSVEAREDYARGSRGRFLRAKEPTKKVVKSKSIKKYSRAGRHA
ncbi:site-specific DNA-methyltransferase [Bradyrhizobium sp. Ai1a-2]|uniref:site-specific DNA-methyltransferase n=1 Tax=Bradyrhizobium sp. Ai1a-2 TaxID=196490 RepID=UPI0009FE76AD|nr:site-specific DNA-methyltransferase [Bradyrhizobium sp. Ai1a-2]